MTVKIISKESLVQLRHHARLEKKKRSERALNTTLGDVIEMLRADLSAYGASPAQRGTRYESETEESVVPELPSDERLGPYEDEWGVRLLLFARNAGAPLLIGSGSKPSKRFEETLRHSAKIRACSLHFYRLLDGYIAMEVEPKGSPSELDAKFLRKRGIHAV